MRGKQRATEGETPERAARRKPRRDSLLLPPIPPSSAIEGQDDSTIGQSNTARGSRARGVEPQVQIVEVNNTVNRIAAENSAPDASDVRAVNVQHPGHKRSRANSGGTSARKRSRDDDQEQQQQFLAAEKECLPQGEALREGGWSHIRPFMPRQECLLAPGKICRHMRLRRTVFSLKGMCTGYDAGRYFMSDLAVQLKQVNETFGRTDAQSWTPAVVCIPPDGKCATHVLQHTATFQKLHDKFRLSMSNTATSEHSAVVDGLLVVLLSAGLSHAAVERAAEYCKDNHIWHIADLQNIDAFCEASFTPQETTQVMPNLRSQLTSDRSWLWRVGAGALLHAPRLSISALTCSYTPVAILPQFNVP